MADGNAACPTIPSFAKQMTKNESQDWAPLSICKMTPNKIIDALIILGIFSLKAIVIITTSAALLLTSLACKPIARSSIAHHEATITIQMVTKRSAGGKQYAILAHCITDGHCKNILRNKDNDPVYFTDAAVVASSIDTDKKQKSKRMKIMAGVALLTGVAWTVFSFTQSKLLLRKTEKLQNFLKKYSQLPQPEAQLEKSLRGQIDEVMGELDKHRVNSFVLESLKEALQQNNLDKAVRHAEEIVGTQRARAPGWEDVPWNFMLGALIATPVLLLDLYNTVAWKNKRNNFFDLFVEGKPVIVTKKELRSLMKVLNKHLKVKPAPHIYSHF